MYELCFLEDKGRVKIGDKISLMVEDGGEMVVMKWANGDGVVDWW